MNSLNSVEQFSSERTPYSLVKLGKLYASSGRYDEAFKYYNEAIDILPNEFGFYYYRGVAEYNMNQFSEALKDFQIALSSDPLNKYEILNFTGAVKFKMGDHPGALDDIEKVLKKNNGRVAELKISEEELNTLHKAG